MKFLFAGCGSIGRRHIANLKALEPSCEIMAYRVRGEPLGEFGKTHAIQEISGLDAALDWGPDAVFVTNPTSLHLPVAMKAAKRGMPLFIEKPLSHSLSGVNDFLRLCQKKKLLVLVGYKMRFHPSVLKIKSLVEKGTVGRVLAAKAQYGGYLPDWHPWEDYRGMYSAQKKLGGGIVLDAIHELDYLSWIMGPVKTVQAMGGRLSNLDIDTEDMVEMLLQFRSGALGNVHANYLQRPEYRSCQIIGEEGSIFWDSLKKVVEVYCGCEKRWERHEEPAGFEANAMFLAEMRHFLACLAGREKPLHTLQEARDILAVSLAARGQCSMKRKK